MVNWDLYNKRLNVNGANKRERMLHRTKDMYNRKLPDSLSHKDVKINGSDGYLIIDSTSSFASNPHKKSFTTVGDTKVVVGDYVEWANSHWLVIEADIDDELCIDGKIQQCNYTLKFQSPTGTILSYPCYTSNNKFSNDENKTITLNSNQKSILLPKDENTLTLKSDRRLFVDTRNQSPYKIIGDIDTTTYNYGDKGLIELLVEQDELKASSIDRVDLGICDYFEHTTIPPADPESPDIESGGYAKLNVSSLILGHYNTIKVVFYNKEHVAQSNVIAVWDVEELAGVNVTYNGNECNIYIDGGEWGLIGKEVVINVDGEDGNYSSTFTLRIGV